MLVILKKIYKWKSWPSTSTPLVVSSNLQIIQNTHRQKKNLSNDLYLIFICTIYLKKSSKSSFNNIIIKLFKVAALIGHIASCQAD